MAVTVTHDFTTLYNGNAGIGGASTYSGFQRFGTACNGGQVSNETTHWTTTVTSFSLVGKRISTWMTAPASAAALASGGYRIVIGDGTNTRAYYVGGGDTAPFVQNGWFCFTLDGDSLPTGYEQIAGAAEPTLSAITVVGIGFNVTTKAVGNSPNVFWDIMQVGTGLTIAGGTSGDPGIFDEIVAWDEQDTAATGSIRRIDAGVYGVQMRLTFGATAADSHFEDTNALVFFEGVPSGTDFYRLTVQGSASHTNVFRLGERLGSGETSIGVSGVTVQSVRPWQMIADTANATVELFGCTLRGATQGVALGGEARSCTFDGNGQVDSGSAEIRFCTFSGFIGTTGAMLWGASTDIQDSDFNGNSRAIEHGTTGPFTYTGLGFSGNTFDINNTSGSAITVNVAGGGTAILTSTGSAVTVQSAATLTITGIKGGSELRIYEAGTTTELFGVETTTEGVDPQYSYTNAQNVDVVVHNVEGYQYWRLEGYALPSSDGSLLVSQIPDRNYNNPV